MDLSIIISQNVRRYTRLCNWNTHIPILSSEKYILLDQYTLDWCIASSFKICLQKYFLFIYFFVRGDSYYQEYSIKSSNGSNDNKRTINMFKCLPVVKYKLKNLKWTCSSIHTESYYDKIFFFIIHTQFMDCQILLV